MVSGISNNSGRAGFFFQSASGNRGTFSVSNDDPQNILQLDPVFKRPSTELREAEEIRKETNPLLDDERQNQPSQENPLSRQVPAEPVFGDQSSRRISAEQSNPTNVGGSSVDVSGGSVTFESGDTSLEIGEGDDARLQQNDDGTVSLINESSGEEATFNVGDEINISGDGEASISGTTRTTIEGGGETAEQVRSSTINLSQGESLTVSENARGIATLEQPSEAESIQLGGQETSINVAGEEGDTFVFTNDQGRSIEFGGGESGSIVENDDGTITISNENTGESETFSSDQNLNTGGNATASLRNEASERLTLEGQDTGQFTTGEEGNLALANTATVEQTEINPRQDPPQPERPLRIQTFDNPDANTAQFLQQQLVTEPDQQAREQREAQEEEAEEQRQRGENEEDSPAVEDGEESLQAASFRPEEQTPSVSDVANEQAEEVAREAEENESAEETNELFAETNESEEEESPFELEDSEENPFGTFQGDEDDSAVNQTFFGNNETEESEDTSRRNRRRLNQAFSVGTSGVFSGQQVNVTA